MQMKARGKTAALMYSGGHVFGHNASKGYETERGARRDKLAALEIDSRCLHEVSFAYDNVEAGGCNKHYNALYNNQ